MGRLFWKFFGIFLLALMTFFFAGIFYMSMQSRSHEDDVAHLRAGFMLSSAQMLLVAGNNAALETLLQDWNSRPEGPFLTVTDRHGSTLPGSSTIPFNAESAREVTGRDGRTYTLASSTPAAYALTPPPSFVPLASGALVSIIFSFFLAWYLTRPLVHLRNAFGEVGRGRLDTRVGHRIGAQRDEIADLGREFDKMADQLQQLIGAQQRLLHDLSHELRSPLARLQVAIGLLRQRPDEQQTALARIETEADRLDRMVQEVLTLARLESGTGAPQRERLDIIELLAAIAEDADFEAQARNCHVQLQASGRFVSEVNGELIYRALENVIRNAVKFTAAGTNVEVTAELRDEGRELAIGVSDRGPGVPASSLETIFEPFRQVEGQTEGGYGLGLAIARRAIESHGGRIVARQAAGGGLRIEISLVASGLE